MESPLYLTFVSDFIQLVAHNLIIVMCFSAFTEPDRHNSPLQIIPDADIRFHPLLRHDGELVLGRLIYIADELIVGDFLQGFDNGFKVTTFEAGCQVAELDSRNPVSACNIKSPH